MYFQSVINIVLNENPLDNVCQLQYILMNSQMSNYEIELT